MISNLTDIISFNPEWSKDEVHEKIVSIAEAILINYKLKVNQTTYAITDLEFYLYHPNHRDEYALGVNHDRIAGELEAHRYGVDIALANELTCKGGALICGLLDIESGEIIPKSKVLRSIINQIHVGSNSIEWVEGKNDWNDIFSSTRVNLGSPEGCKSSN